MKISLVNVNTTAENVLVILLESKLVILVLKISRINFQKTGKNFLFIISFHVSKEKVG